MMYIIFNMYPYGFNYCLFCHVYLRAVYFHVFIVYTKINESFFSCFFYPYHRLFLSLGNLLNQRYCSFEVPRISFYVPFRPCISFAMGGRLSRSVILLSCRTTRSACLLYFTSVSTTTYCKQFLFFNK